MAQQLIESLATDFAPERYKDEYREKVLELIEAKAAGQEIVAAPEAAAPAQVPDLMAALEASLAAVRTRRQAQAQGAGEREGSGQVAQRAPVSGTLPCSRAGNRCQTECAAPPARRPACHRGAHDAAAARATTWS